MNPKELLKQKKAEALALRTKALDSPNDFSAEDSARVDALVIEITDLEKSIAATDNAKKALDGLKLEAKSDDGADGDGGLSSVHNDIPASDLKQDTSKLSMGEQFIQSEGYKALKASHPKGISKNFTGEIKASAVVKEKAILRRPTTGNARAVRTNEVDDLVYRAPRTLLDVITRGTTDLPWFQYRQIISKTNNAAIVPEASSTTLTTVASGYKPLSDLTTTTAEAREFTYADGMEVTNQELTDDGIMRSLIDGTLRENLDIKKEAILLNGAGTADEPAGILNTTGVLQQAFATDMPTSIRKAITKLRVTSNAPIRGVLLNPEDDEAWDLLKDSHGDWVSGPYQMGPGTAWGYERISSQAIPVGKALIGDFSTIHLLQYTPLEVLAFNQHKDYAQRNLTYVRAEERALQLIRNAARLCVVALKATV